MTATRSSFTQDSSQPISALGRCAGYFAIWVIKLGSPFADSAGATNASRLFKWVNGKQPQAVRISREALRSPPPVPTTSIYSRTDGVVPWRLSHEPASPKAESIQIDSSSHAGMGVNPLVLGALADRLAQPEDQWKPFELRGMRRFFYRLPNVRPVAAA